MKSWSDGRRWRWLLLGGLLMAVMQAPASAGPKNIGLANKHWRIVFNCAKPAIASIENRDMGRIGTIYKHSVPQPFFAVTIREADVASGKRAMSWTVNSRDFRTRSIKRTRTAKGETLAWDMSWKSSGLVLDVNLDIDSNATLESTWRFKLKSNRELDATCAFPILDGLEIGENPSDAWYFFPRYSGLLNDIPVDLASVYGQYVRMQVMCAYNPSGAGKDRPAGVYVVTQDTDMMRKSFELTKREKGGKPFELHDSFGVPFWSDTSGTNVVNARVNGGKATGFTCERGIGMSVRWLRVPLRAGKFYSVPTVVLGVGRCDWRDALKSYRKWANGWYPAHNRGAQQYFQHASFDLFAQPNCDAALAELDRHPKPEYMQFMVQKEHVNGDYSYRNDWGLPELQRFVRECKRRGIATNHYFEGYVVNKSTQVWKEHGNHWGQMLGNEYLTAFANQCMWLCQPEWHQWLVGETTRLARDLELDSIYLDEIGWGTGDKSFSDNPAHNPCSSQPDGAMIGVRELLRTVRAALDKVNPKITLYTEGGAVDCLLPYLDGLEDYSSMQIDVNPAARKVPVHFMRFMFPDFKFADIPQGTREEVNRQLKLSLFNGTGICSWSTPGLSSGDPGELVERCHVILRDNKDAFTDLHPAPLVPTMVDGVYCNRFKSPGKTVFTLFNANDYCIECQVLSLPAMGSQYHWVDLYHSAALKVDQTSHGAKAVMRLPAREVAVIAALPVRLEVNRVGERVWLKLHKQLSGEQIFLDLVDQDGVVRERRPFIADSAGFSLAEITSMGAFGAVFKLYQDGVLIDMLPLPRLDSVDLAEAASVSASVRSSEAADLNAERQSNYCFFWDDKVRWVQCSWPAPQTFNQSTLRWGSCSYYIPRKYRYLASDDGQNWRTIADVNRENDQDLIAVDRFPTTTAHFLRIEIENGGLWADRSEIRRWRIYCKPEGI